MNSLLIDRTSGHFAVGTVVVTSIALAVHSFVNIHPFLQVYTQKETWDIFMNFPLLILTYLLGTIITIASSSLFDWINGDTTEMKIERLFLVGLAENRSLVNAHDKLAPKIEMLQSMCLAFILLGLAVILKVITATDHINTHLEHGKSLFFLFGLFLFLCSGVLLWLARKLRKERDVICSKLSVENDYVLPNTP